jgi:predicted component of type VI protein secretion system
MLRSTEPTVDSDVESLQRRTLSDIAQLVQRLLGAHEPRLEIAAQTTERLLCNNQLRFLVA